MPDLTTLLRTYDLKFLRKVAEIWGVTAQGADKRAYAVSLAKQLVEPSLFEEVHESLPAPAVKALATLKQSGGQMSWSGFARHYGDIRTMGPGKREREQPWAFPTSTAEFLYYRALVGREFMRVDEALVEMVFVPSEFLALLPDAPPKEPFQISQKLNHFFVADTDKQNDYGLRVVDDYCTLFSALRLGESEGLLAKTDKPGSYWRILRALGDDLGLLGKDGLPSDLARVFLERSKAESWAWLTSNWANTREFSELRLTPALRCEGSWRNKPLPTRRKLLEWLGALPPGEWFALSDFIAVLETQDPDFLRQGADYELWLIYESNTGRLLRGLDSWQDLEAVFLQFFIMQWLFWLGLIKTFKDNDETFYFSTTQAFSALMADELGTIPSDKEEPLETKPNGLILMSDKTAPIARYQIARFAKWLELGPAVYRYQITPESLARAAKAGLSTRHLLSLLRKYGKSAPAPSLVKALNRWQAEGAEASMENLTILRLKSAEILQELKQSEAKAWLGDSLGPVAVIVKPGGLQKVQNSLARLGYLSDFDLEGSI